MKPISTRVTFQSIKVFVAHTLASFLVAACGWNGITAARTRSTIWVPIITIGTRITCESIIVFGANYIFSQKTPSLIIVQPGKHRWFRSRFFTITLTSMQNAYQETVCAVITTISTLNKRSTTICRARPAEFILKKSNF